MKLLTIALLLILSLSAYAAPYYSLVCRGAKHVSFQTSGGKHHIFVRTFKNSKAGGATGVYLNSRHCAWPTRALEIDEPAEIAFPLSIIQKTGQLQALTNCINNEKCVYKVAVKKIGCTIPNEVCYFRMIDKVVVGHLINNLHFYYPKSATKF